jgi:hypothetical protein
VPLFDIYQLGCQMLHSNCDLAQGYVFQFIADCFAA